MQGFNGTSPHKQKNTYIAQTLFSELLSLLLPCLGVGYELSGNGMDVTLSPPVFTQASNLGAKQGHRPTVRAVGLQDLHNLS